MAILLAIAVIILIVMFGIQASAQSYATAQQAQAQIELARVAQVNAASNLISLLTVAIVVLLILLVLAAIVLMYVRRQLISADQASVHAGPRQIRQPATAQAPMLGSEQISLLIQMKILEMLQSPRPQLPALLQRDEQSADDPLSWLKQ